MRSARFLTNCLPCFLIALLISGCYSALDPIPVRKGNLITIQKSEPLSNPNEPTLTIHWFGTSSYELRLDNISVLTDPFVTYKDPDKVISISRVPNKMTSDYREVLNRYGNIDPPTAIFIGHSHYDHMMDTVAALKLPNWRDIPVYGSPTSKHILAGYDKDEPRVPNGLCQESKGIPKVDKWSENWCHSNTQGKWKKIQGDSQTYQSFKATHAPHLFGITFWDGEHTEDLKEPPRITKDFLTGETYIHFFKFEEPGGVDGAIFTVGLVGAATEVDGTLYGKLKNIADDIQNNIKKKNKKLDVLILCVPGWDNIDGHEYPKNLIDILRPRIILLTHYDNFFDANRNVDPVRLVPSAKFNEFLNKLQKDIDGIPGYDEFESILIPGVGTTLYLNKPPSGVINVSRLSR